MIASFFFYGWWDWRFLFLIISSGLIDYFAGIGINSNPKRKKIFLVISVLGNVGALAVFKYAAFIATNIDSLARVIGFETHLYENIPDFMILLPVGISFYTFQSMSYTIDIYNGKLKPTRNILHFFSYLALFPQLVAGPIVRARDLIPQLNRIRKTNEMERWNGLKLIATGYFKKVVLADNIAPFVNTAFSNVNQTDSPLFWWLTMIGFAFQIYFDFSGYSDIARGLAKWMGLHFRLNFNFPYRSRSLREFWTRWHISLSSWFRDYIYIPLGGSRKGKFRAHLFMWITMLISGLWHGASWNFVIWGAIHAFFLSLERLSGWYGFFNMKFLQKIVAFLLTNFIVLVSWVFFRSPDLDTSLFVLENMFSFGEVELTFPMDDKIRLGLWTIGFSVLIEFLLAVFPGITWSWRSGMRRGLDILYVAIMILAAIYLRGEGNEFIYFQF